MSNLTIALRVLAARYPAYYVVMEGNDIVLERDGDTTELGFWHNKKTDRIHFGMTAETGDIICLRDAISGETF